MPIYVIGPSRQLTAISGHSLNLLLMNYYYVQKQ